MARRPPGAGRPRVWASPCRAARQGGHPRGIGADGVIANAKHFIGDGGTLNGTDQGVNTSSESEIINIHGQGYRNAGQCSGLQVWG